MHALRHVHELLAPGGTMLDLHPVTEEQLEAGGVAVGVLREPEFDTVLANLEASIRQVVVDRLYELEAETSLDVLQHFDTVEDLLERKAENLEGEDALVERIRSSVPPFVVREHAILRRFRVLRVPRRARPAFRRWV